MLQDSLSVQKEVEELKKQLTESEDKNDKLQVGLETCKGDLAARLRDSIALDTHEDTVRELQERLHSRLEDAKTANNKLQEELFKAQKEIRQLKEEADETEKDLKDLRKINERLDHDLEYEKHIVADLSRTNDNLVADLAAKEIQCRSLSRERDDFQLQFTEALLVLKEREEGEAEARNQFEQFKTETKQAALGLSVHNEGLQVDIDTITKQVDEHERIVAIKDECIALLERERDALESELREEKAQRFFNADAIRPPTYRNVSTISHQSLGEELGGLSDAEFDDDEASCSLSDDEEVVAKEVDFELSGVREIINVVPYSIPAPKMTLSVKDAVSIKPRCAESLLLRCSPICDTYSIEPFQPATPMLSVCTAIVVDFLPTKSAAPRLSMFAETVECLPPIGPRPAPLAASSVITTMDYTPVGPMVSSTFTTTEPHSFSSHVDETLSCSPVEPTALALPATPESQTVSTHVIEHVDFSLKPNTWSVIVKENKAFSVNPTMPKYGHKDLPNPRRPSDPKDHCSCNCSFSRKDLSSRNNHKISPSHDAPIYTDSMSQEPLQKPLGNAERMGSGLSPESSSTIRRRHSPIDPFVRLPKSSSPNNLKSFLSAWPLEENKLDETLPQGSSPCIPLTEGINPPRKRLSSFLHYFLHLLFAIVSLHCWHIRNQLYAWEYANGVDFGEGYGNTHDRYGPYGNGHVLLGMLPLNLLSADSPLPVKAVAIITKTVNAFEGWIGYKPTPLY